MPSRKKYLEQESQAEIKALLTLGGTSSNEILQRNGLEEAWASSEIKRNRKGEVTRKTEVSVRGQDIFSIATWERFLEFRKYADAFISLTENADALTEEYYDYLIGHHSTDRYTNLDIAGMRWLRKVARLAVEFHIMRNKMAGLMSDLSTGTMTEDYVCNPFAAFCYQLIQTVKLSGPNVASKINHILDKPKDEDYRKLLIKDFFDEHYRRVFDLIEALATVVNIPEFQSLASKFEEENNG